MKIISSIFVLILFSSFVFGQSTLINQLQENWQIFSPEGEEFSVETPTFLIPGIINLATANSTHNRSYKALAGNNYYYVFSDPIKYPSQQKYVFDFAGKSADLNQENTIFRFADNFGYFHRVLCVKTLGRIYTFQTFSRIENNPQVDRFFAGIKVEFKTPEMKESITTKTQATPLSVTKETRSNGTGRETGNDLGSGNGVGNGIGTGASETKPATSVQSSPIKILSKPRPSYTDYARFYEITGTVRFA